MLSTSIKILWALLLVELHIHGAEAGTVKVGGFFGEDSGVFGDVFGTIINDAINRVKNNRTLIPEPHSMTYIQGDKRPVNAVYTAIEDICGMINADRPSALVVLDSKCPDCSDLAGIISHGSNPVFSVDVGSYNGGSKAFKMYPSPEDMTEFFIDVLNYFKWRAFTLLLDGGDAFTNFGGVMEEVKANDWNVTVLSIDPDDIEGTLVETTTAKSKNILLYCIDETLCKDVLDMGIEMNNRNPAEGSLNSKYTWILGNLDLSLEEQYKDQLENTNAYMTYFTMNFTREYQYTIPSAKSTYDSIYSFPMREKLAFDAVLAIGHALGKFVKRKAEAGQTGAAVLPGDTQMLTCPTAVGKAANNDLTEELMGISFEGMTGNVAFDEIGNRVNYTITIFSGRGDTLRQLRGEWAQNPDYLEDRREQEWQNPGRLNTTAFRIAKDRKIRIVSIEVPPFLFLRENLIQSSNDNERYKYYRYKRQSAPGQYTGNGRYEGYIMELMERIRSVVRGIDFEYEVDLVPDGKYGAASGYSKIWNGMVGEVVRGKADVAAAPITVTNSRKSAVDFTIPFMSSGIQALVLDTRYVHHDPFRVIYPFTIEVWFLSIILFFLVAFMIWAANRYDPYEWRKAAKNGKADEEHGKDFTFFNSLWFCASTLFLQGDVKSPRSNAGRCIAAFWYLYVLFMVFLYIVNVQFFVTSQTRLNYIKDVADLKAEKTITYGTTYKGSDSYHVFKKTSSLKSLWHKMNNDHKKPYVADLKEGVERVRNSNGHYTLLGPSPILRYIASQKPCDVAVTGGYLYRSQFAFAVGKGSPLADHISSALDALRDNGVLEDLERDWWDLDDRWNTCHNLTAFERSGAFSLYINDLSGIYCVLAIGIGASILVFIVELIYFNTRGGSDNSSPRPKKKKAKKPTNDGFFGPQGGDGIRNGMNDLDGARGADDDPNMWI